MDGKSTLFGICNFGLGKREKFEKAVKSSFSKSAKNTSVSIVKVTYSSACRNAVRRSLTDEKSQEINVENMPSTHVAYTVTTDDNVNLNINQAELDVTDSINKKFKKVVTASMTTIALVPTLISIQSNQDILAAKLESIEATVSAKIESIESRLETLMQSLISAVKSDTEAIIGSVSSVETDVAAVKTNTAAIIGSILSVKTGIASVDTDIAAVKTDTEAIIDSVSDVETDIANMDTDVATVKNATEVITGSLSSVETDIVDVDTAVAAVKNDTEAIINSVSNVGTDIIVIDTVVAAVKNDTKAITDSLQDLREESLEAHGKIVKSVQSVTNMLLPPLQFLIEVSHACATDSSKVQCVGLNHYGQALTLPKFNV